MNLYKLKMWLLQMVQWFKPKKSTLQLTFDLNIDRLNDAKEKSKERLLYYKKDPAFQVIYDYLLASYQIELIGVQRISHDDAAGFARHLGRTDALFHILNTLTDLNNQDIVQTIRNEKKRPTSRPIGEFQRPMI